MSVRRRLVGSDALRRALDEAQPVRVVLVPSLAEDGDDRARPLADDASALVERAAAAGARIQPVSDTQLARLSGAGAEGEPPDLLAMVGPDPSLSLADTLALGGAAWLLTGTAYPGNAGFAIRTAELSGADGIVIDTPFDHAERRDARRAAMRADRFLPVHYASAAEAVALARAGGRRIVAIEDVGTRAPWEADLTGPTLFAIGGERRGIAPETLEAADEILRLPMPGFMPSYNLQAAMAAVALERLRQLEQVGPPD